MGRKEWDRCAHCRGTTKCSCGDCRVYLGQGYEKYVEGKCTVCGGEGGRYIDSDTGQPYDSSSSGYSYNTDTKRR